MSRGFVHKLFLFVYFIFFNYFLRFQSYIFYVVCLEWQHQLHQRNKVGKNFGSGSHVLVFALGRITRCFNIFLIC